jgi:hypothetical protein
MNESAAPAKDDRVECPASKDPAVRLFIIAAMMLAFAAWTIYDAYVARKYPYPDPYELNAYLKHLFNHGAAFVLVPLGVLAIGLGLRSLRRVLVADAEGIGYVGKQKIPWSGVARMDASLLKEKGILRLYHGESGRLTLDSWKLGNFKALVAFVEQHVPRDAAGVPEPPDEG